jgi:hypothetical protein
VRRLERELKRGDGLSKQALLPDCQELLTDPFL